MQTKAFLKKEDLEERWQVGRPFVNSLIAAGFLGVVKLSPRVTRIRLEEVKRFESERTKLPRA